MSGLGHHNPIPVANRNQAVMSTIARLLLAQGHGVIDNVQANINWNYIVLGVGARLLVF